MAPSLCSLLYFVSFVEPVAPAPQELTTAGWIFMIGSIGGVLGFVFWCYSRLLGSSTATAVAADGREVDR